MQTNQFVRIVSIQRVFPVSKFNLLLFTFTIANKRGLQIQRVIHNYFHDEDIYSIAINNLVVHLLLIRIVELCLVWVASTDVADTKIDCWKLYLYVSDRVPINNNHFSSVIVSRVQSRGRKIYLLPEPEWILNKSSISIPLTRIFYQLIHFYANERPSRHSRRWREFYLFKFQ